MAYGHSGETLGKLVWAESVYEATWRTTQGVRTQVKGVDDTFNKFQKSFMKLPAFPCCSFYLTISNSMDH